MEQLLIDTMERQLNRLATEMIAYYSGDPMRIQHFMKVHAFSRLIGQMEGMDTADLFTLEVAAYVHDIGIQSAERIYNSSAGPHQEALGPAEAEAMLSRLGFEEAVIRRVCYLVGHHHTYTDIQGLDYQILVEADFLVNLYEDNVPISAAKSAVARIFRTKSGTALAQSIYAL